MTEKEQIEEMVAVMAASNDPFVDVPIEIMPQVAEALYNAGYRKASEVRKEMAKEIFTEIKSLIDNAKEKLPTFFPKNGKYKQGYESSIKHFEKHILELAERMGVEVEER